MDRYKVTIYKTYVVSETITIFATDGDEAEFQAEDEIRDRLSEYAEVKYSRIKVKRIKDKREEGIEWIS